MLPLLAALLLAPPPPAALKIGAAAADMTPPVGYRMAGSYSERLATGVGDPLTVKAISFQQGDARFLLVICDICGLDPAFTLPLREAISKATGTPVSAIAVTATHTHGGPALFDPVFMPELAAAAKKAGKADLRELGDYPNRLAAQCLKAATDAHKSARPATLSAGTGVVPPGVVFNRRFLMKDGSTRFNPGKLHPDIVRPAGPVDETLPLLLAHDAATGKPFASVCCFAMHVAVHGGTTFGADYPAVLQSELRKTYGPDFVSLFGEGTAGDTNHLNTATREPDMGPPQIGGILARSFVDAKKAATPARLTASSDTVKVKLRADQPAKHEQSRDRLTGPNQAKAGFLDKVEAYRILLVSTLRAETGPERPLLVQACAVGDDVAIVTLPHEVFVELGLEIRKRSPFKHTLVITLANDLDVYVPTRAGFVQGGYEAVNSPYESGVGEALVESACAQLKKLAKP